jgi:hypothetical protein
MKQCDFHEPQTCTGRMSVTLWESNINRMFSYASVTDICNSNKKSFEMNNYSGTEILVQKKITGQWVNKVLIQLLNPTFKTTFRMA